jgi:preprotein translocase subunit SecD
MLQIPLFNRILIVLVVLAGLSFAMPNLFYERVERHNDAAAEIEATGVTTEENAAALAGWPEFLPSTLVNLGLDLRGGAHLLAEVAVEDVYDADGFALARGAGRAARPARHRGHDPPDRCAAG